MTSFVLTSFRATLVALLFTGLPAIAVCQTSTVPDYHTRSVADTESPIIGCATVLAPGEMVLAEHFFQTYEFAYRRVALLRAHGFEHAQLLHTDCQPVDVKGGLYIVTISPFRTSENELLSMMEEYYRRGKEAGLDIHLLRIVRNIR